MLYALCIIFGFYLFIFIWETADHFRKKAAKRFTQETMERIVARDARREIYHE